MPTLKSAVYAILEADAQLTGSSNLGHSDYLGQSSSAPYGVYFRNPPESVDLVTTSIITYFVVSSGGRKPRNVYINITAWGDNYENILERVHELLHEARLSNVTDFEPLMIKWDTGGSELFDEEKRCYYQQHRYLIKAWKK